MNREKFHALVNFLRKGGTIVIVRHGNTDAASQDFWRMLSDLGKRQAAAMRLLLEQAMPGSVDLVLSSVAVRARDTVTDPEWPRPRLLVELYPPSEESLAGRVCEAAFQKLKHAPLSAYYAESGVATAMEAWAATAMEIIELEFQAVHPTRTVVIGCHGMWAAQLALAIMQAANPAADVKVALDSVLGECEAFCIGPDPGEPHRLNLGYLDRKLLKLPTV